MVVKEEYSNKIDLDYARHAIQEVLLSQGFRWSKTASKEKVEKLTIDLPIDAKGNIDLIGQKNFTDKLKKIEEIKKAVNIELSKLSESKIEFD